MLSLFWGITLEICAGYALLALQAALLTGMLCGLVRAAPSSDTYSLGRLRRLQVFILSRCCAAFTPAAGFILNCRARVMYVRKLSTGVQALSFIFIKLNSRWLWLGCFATRMRG